MTAPQSPIDRRRHRLAANHTEIVVADVPDRRRHRLAANHTEIVVPDEPEDLDIEGHRLATNDNETVVEGTELADPDADETDAEAGPRKSLTRNHSETLVEA